MRGSVPNHLRVRQLRGEKKRRKKKEIKQNLNHMALQFTRVTVLSSSILPAAFVLMFAEKKRKSCRFTFPVRSGGSRAGHSKGGRLHRCRGAEQTVKTQDGNL